MGERASVEPFHAASPGSSFRYLVNEPGQLERLHAAQLGSTEQLISHFDIIKLSWRLETCLVDSFDIELR